MKAIVIHQAGDAQQLQIEERPIPALKKGWTLVKVKGFGINRSEIFTRQVWVLILINFPSFFF